MIADPTRYLVAGRHAWNREAYEKHLAHLPGVWRYLHEPDELAPAVAEMRPRYVFFLHWSRHVPESVLEQTECVCFHMTDVPYGRGGSPLQHLILRGHRTTKLSALRMVRELDAGPVYFQEELALAGSAEDIYRHASVIAAGMAARIAAEQPEPQEQRGETIVFVRRRPEESLLPPLEDPSSAYDFIRMLDAEGYPRAFLVHGGLRFEFRRARLGEGAVTAEVTITKEEP